MFRNTFFPMWQLVIEKAFGFSTGPFRTIMDGLETGQPYASKAETTATKPKVMQRYGRAEPSG
jgi:hypothetical protein